MAYSKRRSFRRGKRSSRGRKSSKRLGTYRMSRGGIRL